MDSVVYGCTDGSEVRQYRCILTIAQKCWICQYGSILTITLTVAEATEADQTKPSKIFLLRNARQSAVMLQYGYNFSIWYPL